MAIGAQGLIGSYFFEDEHGKAETVNSERYLVVLKKFKAALRRRRLQLQASGPVVHAGWGHCPHCEKLQTVPGGILW